MKFSNEVSKVELKKSHSDNGAYKFRRVEIKFGTNPENIESGFIYFYDKDHYYIRDPKGNVQHGMLSGNPNVGTKTDDLDKLLLDKEFKKSVLIMLCEKGHVLDEELCIEFADFMLRFFESKRDNTNISENNNNQSSEAQYFESGHKTESKVKQASLKQQGKVDEVIGRCGLFTHEKKNADELKALFEQVIPMGFELREAKDKGDCFYDSCAQELNEMSLQKEYTIKSLRLLCHEYAVELDKSCKNDQNHPNNWIGKALNYDIRRYQEYLANVRYTAEERELGEGIGDDKLAVRGEVHIDGKILCERLGINLHVIEVRENPDDETNKTQKFIISHNLVDHERLGNVEKYVINWYDKKVLHIAVCNLHFFPIGERPQYFITSDSVNKFLKYCHNNIRIYIGLSVGQYYHEGNYAKSQILCLQNLREACAQYLKNELEKHGFDITIKIDWLVDIIVADSLQMLNKMTPVELKIDMPDGQCMKLLSENIMISPEENKYIERGKGLEACYRELLRPQSQQDQCNVVINLTQERRTYRWSQLKEIYKDPLFIKLINDLETCFKFGAKQIELTRGNNINSKNVTVNLLTYALSEIVMHYKIFLDNELSGEVEPSFIFYPGPGDLIVQWGKKMLDYLLRQHGKKNASSPCFELRTCEIGSADANNVRGIQFFSNIQDNKQHIERIKYIEKHVSPTVANDIFSAEMSYSLELKNKQYFPVFKNSKLRTTAHYDNKILNEQCSKLGELENVALELLDTEIKGNMSQDRLIQILDKAASYPNTSAIVPNFIRTLFYKKFHDLEYMPTDDEKEQDRFIFAKHEIYARFKNLFFTPNDLLYLIYLHSNSYPMTEFDFPRPQPNINRDSSQQLFDRFVRQLSWDIQYTESFACVLLVAARLERLDLPKFSIWVYGYLLSRNYSPFTQLANLMRVGGTKHFEAYYYIGSYLIKNDIGERLYGYLVSYLKKILNRIKLSPECNKFTFDLSRNLDHINLGIICLKIVLHYCQDEITMSKAALLLSELYLKGIEGHIKPRSDYYCHALEVAYEKCNNHNLKEKILTQLHKFNRAYPQDLFVKATLAYILGLSQFVNESISVNIDIINAAYEDFLCVYNSLSHFVIEDAIVVCLREKSFKFSKLLSDCKQTDSNWPAIQTIAQDLLNRSANLGSYSALRKLAVVKSVQKENSDVVKILLENVLEAAMVSLDINAFELNLGDYNKYAVPSDNNKVKNYESRLNDLRNNLEALMLYKSIQKRAPITAMMLKLTSIFQDSLEEKQLKQLSNSSPLAIALLPACNESKSERLLNEIVGRGLLDNNTPDFPTHFICFLTDHYILVWRNKNAKILFLCLRDSLESNSIVIDEHTRVCCSILVEFFICMIENEPQSCERFIKQSPDLCRQAFQSISRTRLINLATYNSIKTYIEHPMVEILDLESDNVLKPN